METLIATALGAVLAGIAMIANSYFSSKIQLQHLTKQSHIESENENHAMLTGLFENLLSTFDRLARNLGSDKPDVLERLYKMRVKLELHTNDEIVKAHTDLSDAISKMASSLTPLPKQFIPKFEEDDNRRHRQNELNKIKELRKSEAREYMPDIYEKTEHLKVILRAFLKDRSNYTRSK